MFIYIQKINLVPKVFLGILHFKESCNLIGLSVLIHNLRARQVMGFAVKYKWQCFILDYFQRKLEAFFSKNPLFLAHCVHIWAKQNVPQVLFLSVFFKKNFWLSIVLPSKYCCAKLRKSNEWFPRNTEFKVTYAYIHGTGISWNTSYFVSFWLWNKLFKC